MKVMHISLLNFLLLFLLIWTLAAGCLSEEEGLNNEGGNNIQQSEPGRELGPNIKLALKPNRESKPPLVPEPDFILQPPEPEPEPEPDPLPCPPPGDYSNCLEVVPGHNNLCENRMNLVFVGVSYADMPAVISAVETAVDYDENNGGLLSVEPFKSNKNKLNFFYVNQVGTYDTSALGEHEWPHGVERIIDDLGASCPITTNKYVVGLINWDFGGSNPEQVSFANPSSSDDINTFIHEVVGHLLGGFNDEYCGAGLGGPDVPWGLIEQSFYSPSVVCNPVANPRRPWRCISTAESYADCLANSPWHDLIGNGCGEDGVIDCFTIDFDNPECETYGFCRDRVIDLVGDGSYWNEVACFMESGWVNYYRSVHGSRMVSSSLPYFGASNERLICEKIRDVTGSAGGICDQLCLDRCPVGQSCIRGSCQPTPATPIVPPVPPPNCPPSNLRANPVSCTKMSITWEPPLDSRCVVKKYRIERVGTVVGTVPARDAMVFSDDPTISELIGHTYYTISSLDAGGGIIGDQRIGTMPPPCGSCLLHGIVVDPFCQIIFFRWTPPPSTECPPIHQYRFARSDWADFVTRPAPMTNWHDNTPHVEETRYSYTVTTLDETGAVIETQEVSTTTPFCSGCSPLNLTATPVSCSEIVVTWAPPADGRCEVYRYQVVRYGGVGWERRSVPAMNPLTVVFSGLLESTEYLFTVESQNVSSMGTQQEIRSSTPACP